MRNLFENIKFSRYSYSNEELESLVNENNMPVDFTCNVNNIIVFDGITVSEMQEKMTLFVNFIKQMEVNPNYLHVVKNSYELVYSVCRDVKIPQLIIRTEKLFTFLKGFVLGYSYK